MDGLSVSKSWDNVHFWVNYPLKSIHICCPVYIAVCYSYHNLENCIY